MAELRDLIVYGSSNLIGEVFSDIIHANSFKTNGGTQNDFVKGDGSLDSSSYITAADVPEYTIEKLGTAEQGYSSSYILKKGEVQVGDTINIPKDMVVSSGEVKTVTTVNVPYQGAQVGDKYIDLIIANTSQNHIYIPVKDLVDVYTSGNGITINSNAISVVIDTNNANGLSVGANGVSLSTATTSSAGAMSAADKIKLDGIAAGAEVNVQSDWNQTIDTEDDYIKNKPSIPTITFRQW